MELFKYIITRVLAFALGILVLNELYKRTFYKDDVSTHADVLENLWVVDEDVDAIYFGESSNFHVAEGDTGSHRISTILDTLLPDLKIGTVDHSGIHSGTYLALIQNIPSEMDLKYLIVTMNFRSFDAMWRYSQFETNLAKAELMMQPRPAIINKFLTSLNYYDLKTDEERQAQMHHAWETDSFNIPGFQFHTVDKWDSAMAWQHFVEINPYLTVEQIPLAAHYVKNFAFEIDTLTNERIHDFDAIMDWADERGVQVIFPLLGENMEEGRKLAGDELIYLMEKNRQLLKERYRRKGAIVVDVMDDIPDSNFVDRHWPTEHYDKEGKAIVAEKIAEALEEYRVEE